MFDKWIQSATDIVTITCKELCSLQAKKRNGSGKEQEKRREIWRFSIYY